MKYIKLPNIPEGKASLAVIDGRADDSAVKTLNDMGIQAIRTESHAELYPAISQHPDIVLHHLGDEYIVYAPGLNEGLFYKLKDIGFHMIEGQAILGTGYPYNIAYNVARVGSFAFHNFKYTDPVLKNELLKRNVELIDIKQGYSKCSISIVDENAIITSDMGIAKAAIARKIDTLVIGQDENILLPGLNNGFIGGSTGLIAKNKWAISGSLETLKSWEKINNFLYERGIEVVSLTSKNVVDIGSIIPLAEE